MHFRLVFIKLLKVFFMGAKAFGQINNALKIQIIHYIAKYYRLLFPTAN